MRCPWNTTHTAPHLLVMPEIGLYITVIAVAGYKPSALRTRGLPNRNNGSMVMDHMINTHEWISATLRSTQRTALASESHRMPTHQLPILTVTSCVFDRTYTPDVGTHRKLHQPDQSRTQWSTT